MVGSFSFSNVQNQKKKKKKNELSYILLQRCIVFLGGYCDIFLFPLLTSVLHCTQQISERSQVPLTSKVLLPCPEQPSSNTLSKVTREADEHAVTTLLNETMKSLHWSECGVMSLYLWWDFLSSLAD